MRNVYHVNLETGETGPCRAQKKCPFGGDEIHFTSESSAREAYEKHMSGDRPFSLKKVVVTEDEERVNRRINEGDLQNGDLVAYTDSDGVRALGQISERNGELLIQISGRYTDSVKSALSSGKITAREPGEKTKGELSDEIAALYKKRNRLTKQDSLDENQRKILELTARRSEILKAEVDEQLKGLSVLTDEQLARRDKSARAASYEATMGDYSIGSINRAQDEVSLIGAEIKRRREAAIASGDKPYEDGTRPSDYGDKSGYGILTNAGGKWDSNLKGYVLNGDLIEERRVDGRGVTFITRGVHYADPVDAFNAISGRINP